LIVAASGNAVDAISLDNSGVAQPHLSGRIRWPAPCVASASDIACELRRLEPVLTRVREARPRCHCPGRVDFLTPRASPGLTAFKGIGAANTVVPVGEVFAASPPATNSHPASACRQPFRQRADGHLHGERFSKACPGGPSHRRPAAARTPGRPPSYPFRELVSFSPVVYATSAPSLEPSDRRSSFHAARLRRDRDVAAIVAAILAARKPGRRPLPCCRPLLQGNTLCR